jgi:excisionase family DNA binding protein
MLTQSQPLELEAFLTVSQAAERLSVHPSTIRRWIECGRLPAYRLGEKRVGVKPSDLVRLVSRRTPRLRKERHMTRTEQHAIPSLTSSEQERGLRALALLEQLDQALLERRSGQSLAPSWELLNQAREERMAELIREQ